MGCLWRQLETRRCLAQVSDALVAGHFLESRQRDPLLVSECGDKRVITLCSLCDDHAHVEARQPVLQSLLVPGLGETASLPPLICMQARAGHPQQV